jgi:hypothetical protein
LIHSEEAFSTVAVIITGSPGHTLDAEDAIEISGATAELKCTATLSLVIVSSWLQCVDL